MQPKKFSEYTATTELDGNEIVPIVKNGANSVAHVKDLPVSESSQAALDLKADEADLLAHTSNTSNPHATTKAQVGLGNADNTSDAAKPVSTAQAAAIAGVQADVDGHEANTSNPHSVTKAQVGLGNADNTSDAAKPVSVATQAALDGKQPLDSDLTQIAGLAAPNDNVLQRKGGIWVDRTPAQLKVDLVLVKADVGLGNVDNTSDANKPVSTAQQTALDLKANLASPALTGAPTAPTAAPGTNTTQIATAAFVRTEVANLVAAAPGTLDTLNELALALGNDPNFATTMTNSLALKANDNAVVHLTGAETVGGAKTFTSGLIVNLSGAGTVLRTQISGADRLVFASSGGNDSITASGGGSNLVLNAASIQMQIGGTERARLHSNGNFGIGVTAPTTKLEVGGVIKGDSVTIVNAPSAANDAVTKSYVDAINTALSAALTQKTRITVGTVAGADFVYTTNDLHTKLQAAVDALPASGGKIYINGGNYVATGRVNINKAFVEIELAPDANITISGSISLGGGRQDYMGLFQITKPYVWVHGGTIDLNNQVQSNAFGVWGGGTDDSVYTTYHIKFSDMVLKNHGTASGSGAAVFGWLYGGTVNGDSRGRIKDVLFQRVTFDTSADCATGWIGDYFKDIIYDDCTFRYIQHHSIVQSGYLRMTSDRIIVRNSLFEHNRLDSAFPGSLCDIHDGSRTGGVDMWLVGNKHTGLGDVSNQDSMAINIHGWRRVFIDGNSISDMNQAFSFGQSQGGTVWTQEGCTEVFVTNNVLENLRGVVDNDATYHIMWNGNHFRHIAFRAIGWYSSHQYQTITDNHFYDCNDRVEDDAFLLTVGTGMVRADIPAYDYAIIENGGNDRTLVKNNFMIDDRRLGDPGAAGITLTDVAGGALASRTYSVRLTYANTSGETLASDAVTRTVAANNLLKVTPGTPAGYANRYSSIGGIRQIKIYVAINGSPETLQATVDYPKYGVPTWTEPTTGLVAGAALPTSNTTHNLTRYAHYTLPGYLGAGLNEFVGNHLYGIPVTTATEGGGTTPLEYDNYVDGQRQIGDPVAAGSDFRIALQPPTVAAALAAGGSLTVGKTYYWWVTALNGLGESLQSNEVHLLITTGNQTGALTWPATPGATQYKVYRSNQAINLPTNSFVATTSTNSYSDTGAVSVTAGQPPIKPTGFINRINPNGDSYIGGGNFGIGVNAPTTILDMAGALTMREMAAPSTSGVDRGRIYFDATANKFKVSENNGAYVDLYPGQSLAAAASPTFAGLTLTGLSGVLKAAAGVVAGSATTSDLTEGSNLYYTDERAQDAIGGILTDSATIDFTYNDAANTITAVVLPAGIDRNTLGGSALTLANGGTNATSASGARTSLGLVIGTDVQAYNANLATIGGLTPTNDDILQRKAGAWINRTPAQLKTDLVLVKGDVGLGNVDNTSDATKNSATATLTGKTVVSVIVQGEKVIALTDGATIATDASLGNIFTVTIGGNRTISNPTNPTDGQKIIYRIKQDATGGRTITWGAAFRFSTDLPTPVLSGTAALTDYLMFVYNGTDSKWDLLAINRGF